MLRASQSEGCSGSFTPKAMVGTASFAAVEAAVESSVSGGDKHSDREKCYSLFPARRPPSAVFHSGIPSISRRRIDFTFFKRQSTVNGLQQSEKQKNTHREFNCTAGLGVTAEPTTTYSCGRFRCQFCVKGRALGWMSLSPFGPLQPWHGAAN